MLVNFHVLFGYFLELISEFKSHKEKENIAGHLTPIFEFHFPEIKLIEL